jgi:hypothetical protein
MAPLRRPVSRTSRDNASRLRKALDAGSGHIAVFGDAPHDALAFVDAFLAHAARYSVARASVLRPQAMDNVVAQLAPTGTTVMVVNDAEGANAAQLERLRGICEKGVDAAERLRLIIVGAAGLERALADPDARALASRIGMRLRVGSIATTRELFAPKPQTSRRWAFVASAVTAAAAIVCMAYTDLPAARPATRLAVRLADGAVALRDRAVDAIARRVLDDPRDHRAGASATKPSAPLVVTSRTAGSARTAIAQPKDASSQRVEARGASQRSPQAAPGIISPSGAMRNSAPTASATPHAHGVFARAGNGSGAAADFTMHGGSGATGRAYVGNPGASVGGNAGVQMYAARSTPPRKDSPAYGVAARPMASHPILATVVSLFVPAEIGDRVIATGGALVESIMMMARILAGEDAPRGVNRPVQLGVFDRPQPAFALKSTLVRDFNRVAVARFDPDTGTFFSVRVFDADQRSRAVASPAVENERSFAAAP